MPFGVDDSRGHGIVPVARTRVLLALIVGASLAARLAFVLTVPPATLHWDESGYDASARRLVATGTYAYPRLAFAVPEGTIVEAAYVEFLGTRPNAWTMPGYPVFLAAVYRVTGTGEGRLAVVRVLQALLGALTVLLAYAIGVRARDRTVGLVSALLLALYVPSVWSAASLLTEPLYTFLLALAVWLVLAALDEGGYTRFAAAGAAFAAAAYVRPTALPWLAVPVLALLVARPRRVGRAVREAGVLLAVVALLLVPWPVRNWTVYGRFVPLTTSSSNPLYLSTTPGYEGGGAGVAVWPTGLRDDEAALDAWWSRQAWSRLAEELRTRPFSLVATRVARAGRAVATYWPRDPSGRPGSSVWLHAFETALQWLLWLLLPVGVVLGRRCRNLLLAASVPVYFLLVHGVSLMLPRYLHPGVVGLAVVAAYASVEAGRRMRAAGRIATAPVTPR